MPLIDSRRVRIGCSSFSSRDWVGPFYPEGTAPKDYLRIYARHFDCVEVDATYYALPTPSTVRGWDEKTPTDFLLCAKFPRSIVHAGDGPAPEGTRLLTPDATYSDRDAFLQVMSSLGSKLGPLLLQFPYFNRGVFASRAPFLERLDRFLEDLPGDFHYTVEIRNRSWLDASFTGLLRRHGVSLALVDQAWMPHGDELEGKLDLHPASPMYLRLLGDRKKIEALTSHWDREVIDRSEGLDRWARFLVRRLREGQTVLVFVNNHYAGHAPATARRLREMLEAALSRG